MNGSDPGVHRYFVGPKLGMLSLVALHRLGSRMLELIETIRHGGLSDPRNYRTTASHSLYEATAPPSDCGRSVRP